MTPIPRHGLRPKPWYPEKFHRLASAFASLAAIFLSRWGMISSLAGWVQRLRGRFAPSALSLAAFGHLIAAIKRMIGLPAGVD